MSESVKERLVEASQVEKQRIVEKASKRSAGNGFRGSAASIHTRAVIYARQSDSETEEIEKGNSLSSRNQIARCTAYCDYNQFEVNQELSLAAVDLDISGGAKLKDRKRGVRSWQRRAGLMRLYEAAERHEFEHLVVYDTNRLGGDATELHLIREAFGDLGVTIHVVSHGIRTDNDAGRAMFGLFAEFAEQRLRDIGKTFRDAAYQRATEGKHHGKPPFWIDYLPSYAQTPEQVAIEVAARGPKGTAGWYRLNEHFAPVMREVALRRLKGASYTDIAHALNSLLPEDSDYFDPQYPEYAEWRRSNIAPTKLDLRWTTTAVRWMLNDNSRLRMRGVSVFGRYSKAGDDRRVVTPGILPAVLTVEESDALDVVQNTLSWRGFGPTSGKSTPDIEKSRERHVVRQHTTLLCSSLIHCAFCRAAVLRGQAKNSLLRAEYVAGGYWKYKCFYAGTRPDVVHWTMREGSKSMNLSREKIEGAVLHALAVITERLPAAPPPKPAAKKIDGKPKGAPKRTVEEIDELIDSLTELRGLKRISEADFDRKYAAHVKERTAVVEWEESQYTESEQERAFTMLRSMSEEPTTAELRLVLRMLVDWIEAPILLPDAPKVESRNRERMAVRLHFKTPLPDGSTSALSLMYRDTYRGKRWLEFEQPSSGS